MKQSPFLLYQHKHTGQSVSAQIQLQTIDGHKRGDSWFADKTTDGRKDRPQNYVNLHFLSILGVQA